MPCRRAASNRQLGGAIAPTARAALEAAKLEQEIRKLTAEANEAEAKAAVALAELRDKEASANRARVYPFIGAVGDASVRQCMATLATWSRREPGADMTIVFNSEGGSVVDGLALYDYVDELKRDGHKITTVARGGVFSMGSVLLQAGNERVIGLNATMLIHELSAGVFGSYGEIKDRQEWHDMLMDRLFAILAERSTLTLEEVRGRAKRKDWWLTAEQVVEYGFADRIG